jgi:putative hydrolase of the HAD superfamily
MGTDNNEIKVIFLDAGGVLFDTFMKKEERVSRLLTGRGYPKAEINAAILMAKQNTPDLFVTNWAEEQQYSKNFFGNISKALGDPTLTDELVYFAHYARHCELFPEVKEALDALSLKYRLGVISNATPSLDWIFDWLGIRHYFESIILSAFVKVAKPNEAIYHIALERMQAQNTESIFIDDKLENIEAAEKLGMKGIHLEREQHTLLTLLKINNLV